MQKLYCRLEKNRIYIWSKYKSYSVFQNNFCMYIYSKCKSYSVFQNNFCMYILYTVNTKVTKPEI